MTPNEIETALSEQGYIPRQAECLAIATALRPAPNTRAILLSGDPGVGKSFLAESWAKATDAACLVHQCHQWTDSDELYAGVDVKAAVSGDAEHVTQLGVLARAAAITKSRKLVLLIDELDKASDATEALFLDFLQSGRVQIAPGKAIKADLTNLLVFVTCNDNRPIGEALMRRCIRVHMTAHNNETIIKIVKEQTDLPTAFIAHCVAFIDDVLTNAKVAAKPSVQEIREFCLTCYHHTENPVQISTAALLHIARSKQDAIRASAYCIKTAKSSSYQLYSNILAAKNKR